MLMEMSWTTHQIICGCYVNRTITYWITDALIQIALLCLHSELIVLANVDIYEVAWQREPAGQASQADAGSQQRLPRKRGKMSRSHQVEDHQPTAVFRAELLGFLTLRDLERKGSKEWREATDQFVHDIVAAAARYRADGIETVKEIRASRIQETARLTQQLTEARSHQCKCQDQ